MVQLLHFEVVSFIMNQVSEGFFSYIVKCVKIHSRVRKLMSEGLKLLKLPQSSVEISHPALYLFLHLYSLLVFLCWLTPQLARLHPIEPDSFSHLLHISHHKSDRKQSRSSHSDTSS